MAKRPPRAMILGCCGPELNETERRFFADANPLGFILFARNCIDPGQLRALVGALRESVGRADAPILIDQEGGRVTRLKPPHWWAAPAAQCFADLARRDADRGAEAARLGARLIAAELNELGISINCVPVLDVPQPGASPAIGDRAVGDTPARAAALGHAVCEGVLDGGLLPVIKHIPGHGRALVDSHDALPEVTVGQDDLECADWVPFRALSAMPWAMTGHVVYQSIDASQPATTSAKVIGRVIRDAIGFDGVLISDDLSMKALKDGPGPSAGAALAAGCDLVLHCNGVLTEMEAVTEAVGPCAEVTLGRLARAEAMRRQPKPFDMAWAHRRLDGLLRGEEDG
ncbi:MAG: beta-N-acetylhexosaminidase [Rhodospirillales bacterium]|nr:beta-N-acetylhexosaminidase [Rhodospirillales bacterium]MDP7652192.1 beta-N-acetylhexosaminidase [Rhodospirillales bacterium]